MFCHGIAASNDSIVEQKHFKDWRNCSTDKLMFGNFCTFSTDQARFAKLNARPVSFITQLSRIILLIRSAMNLAGYMMKMKSCLDLATADILLCPLPQPLKHTKKLQLALFMWGFPSQVLSTKSSIVKKKTMSDSGNFLQGFVM